VVKLKKTKLALAGQNQTSIKQMAVVMLSGDWG
jgi:hypothetical protein